MDLQQYYLLQETIQNSYSALLLLQHPDNNDNHNNNDNNTIPTTTPTNIYNNQDPTRIVEDLKTRNETYQSLQYYRITNHNKQLINDLLYVCQMK